MTAMKKTLLAIVQDILSDTDGEAVNSLSDSLEADQAATIVEHVFYDIIANRNIPEHIELIKLTALSDSATPTHFKYPDNVNQVTKVWYDRSAAGTLEYEEIRWCDPEEFLRRTDKITSSYTSVLDPVSGTTLRIRNDKHPEFYTSFDDFYIVMDSHLATLDTTLQESKVRCMGTKFPVFDRSDDDYIPDIDSEFFPYLIAESRSRFMDWYKGGTTRKAEQAATRNKIHVRNNRYRTERPNKWNAYGR